MKLPQHESSLTESLAELRHRVRTPLNHIIGYTEMLLEDAETPLSAEMEAQLRDVHRLAQGLVSLIQSALAPAGGTPNGADVERFRKSIIAPVQKIVRGAANVVQVAPEDALPDLLRVTGAGAELLEFAQLGVTKRPSQRLRPDVIVPARGTSQASASVLVVDDDDANRDILARQLQRLGFSVVTAQDGADALARVETQPFDILLIDFMMPGMDGLDVLQALKEDPATQDIPVIMISALDELSGVMHCIERGAEDYLFKPFEPVLLSARISAALERTRLRALERERTRELERIGEELRRSNDDLNCFAYAASHDLQAPLRTIATHLQLLERRFGKTLSPEDRELLRFPVDAAQRMSQLIKDLLTFSQVTTEEHEFTPVSCEQILQRTLNDLKANIAESHATITHGPLPVMMADETLMQQLFLNLIGNSIKYRSEQPPRIHVAAERAQGAWHFSVSDNGVGIPPEHLDSVFDMFKRLHGHERPGTGLGLSICKRIVERLGGRIWAESREGEGSTFHFTIAEKKGASESDTN